MCFHDPPPLPLHIEDEREIEKCHFTAFQMPIIYKSNQDNAHELLLPKYNHFSFLLLYLILFYHRRTRAQRSLFSASIRQVPSVCWTSTPLKKETVLGERKATLTPSGLLCCHRFVSPQRGKNFVSYCPDKPLFLEDPQNYNVFQK